MVKARTILYALVISLFIYIITGSYFFLRFYHDQSILKNKIFYNLKNNCSSAFAYYQANPLIFEHKATVTIDLYNNGQDLVKAYRSFWGAFEILTFIAEKGNLSQTSCFFVGAIKNSHGALYIVDNNKYITAKGNTLISGDIYVPGALLKRTAFFGKINPVDSIRHSNKKLPGVFSEYLDFVENLKKIRESSEPGKKDVERLNDTTISFLDSTYIFYSANKIDLSDVKLNGNIIIRSGKSVTISSTTQINNIIISAPEIIVSQGFNGCVQIFADTLLKIEKGCNFRYPSFIGIYTESNASIEIPDNVILAGGVAINSDNRNINMESVIRIEGGSKIYGLVYTNNTIELGGDIFGTLICNNVKSADKYFPGKDIILNCQINPMLLKDNFYYPVLFENSGRGVIFQETKNVFKGRNIN